MRRYLLRNGLPSIRTIGIERTGPAMGIKWIGLAFWFASLVTSAQADIRYCPFRERVQKSALIICGTVETQHRVALGLASLFGDLFTYTRESTVRVERCLKGNAAPGDIVRVRTDNDFLCDVSSLEEGCEYLLMLETGGPGYYVDVNSGRGEWIIRELGEEQRVYREIWEYGGDPLSEFEKWVKWAMSEPAVGSPEVVGDATRALVIAEQEIARAGISVQGFLLQPVVRDEPDRGYDGLAEFPGFCDDGEVVWCVRWIWPGYSGSWADPSWAAVRCYVHPLSGDPRIADHPAGRRLTPEELMLVTCGRDENGKPYARQITKEEFMEKANRAERYDEPVTAPDLPPRAHFFEARSPRKRDKRVALLLLDDTPKVVFYAMYPWSE